MEALGIYLSRDGVILHALVCCIWQQRFKTDPAPHILQLWPQAGGNRFSFWFASADVLAAD